MPTTVSRGRTLIARVLCIGGLAGMFLGVLDPLEGSGAILAGTGCESFRVTLSGDHAARAGVVGVVLAE
jgi:hypothetical protein